GSGGDLGWAGAGPHAAGAGGRRMREGLPPVAFLRAFSRAAETLSFKETAADLGLSPSALSRQIQALEAHLGIVLFRRLNPGLEITDEGRRYLESVNRALAELRRGQEAVAAPRSRPLPA